MRMGTKAQKRPVNLTIDADLLDVARRKKLNLSSILERSLRAETMRLWLENNRDAIEAYNEDVSASGVWSEVMRRW
jgi:antitoxin CcdA